jgi:hypothetical protein
VDWLNGNAPAANAAWLEGNAIADFKGRAFTNSWHSEPFYTRFRETTSPEAVSFLAQDMGLTYFIVPAADSGRELTNVHTREFADRFTTPVLRAGSMELRRWSPPDVSLTAPPPPYAPPGKHDEVNAFITYAGRWTRDLQFGETWKRTLVYTNDTRSRLLIRFNGAGIRLVYTAAGNRCEGLVSLDEGDPVSFNEYSAKTRWQSVSPAFRPDSPGNHTLMLRFPQNRGGPVVGGCFLDLDGFIVE